MTYEIKMTERATFLNERLNPVDGYRITFQMADGTIDWIELPKAQYNAEAVKAGILLSVKLHESIIKP